MTLEVPEPVDTGQYFTFTEALFFHKPSVLALGVLWIIQSKPLVLQQREQSPKRSGDWPVIQWQTEPKFSSSDLVSL